MSTLSLNTQFTLISLFLLIVNTSNVHARDCVRVSGISSGASAGIAIGAFVLFMSLISIIFWWQWRRRLWRRGQIYITDPNANPAPQPQMSQVQIQPPAFPPQAYGGQQPYEGVPVENRSQFAAPAGPPPV
ncbi:hypothetical protein Clacol_003123 [Clathrus columnatus]|uniref:Uncharacterized protein n=1 Tax=Clathrus columnatus TaxID=1419009 RepID=A0AAV5A6Q0_9AGAM|nr:hypothetical protein Clacol_003123 [Clathrus columnatus]